MLAERQIRRLQAQHKEDRLKLLSGRPRRPTDDDYDDLDVFEGEDQLALSSSLLSQSMDLPGERRLCRQIQQLAQRQHSRVDVTSYSKEQLLEASLNSLESLGQKMKSSTSFGGGSFHTIGDLDDPAYLSFAVNNSSNTMGYNTSSGNGGGKSAFPSEHYLRGAMWLAHNWIVFSEELASEVDSFKAKQLADLTSAQDDSNLRRSCQRLALLAGAGVTEVATIFNKYKLRTNAITEVLDSYKYFKLFRFIFFIFNLIVPYKLFAFQRR